MKQRACTRLQHSFTPENADIMRHRISIITPIGVALLGLSEGAAFYWDTRNNQRRTLTVIGVAPPVQLQTSRSTESPYEP